MKHKQVLMENDQVRQAKTLELESVQKIDRFGASKWPSQSDVINGDEESSESKSKPSEGSVEPTLSPLEVIGQTIPEDFEPPCPGLWEMDVKEYTYAPPGCFGFNGHQVVFHCFQPGKPYMSRNACADTCLLKLGNLDTGEQSCTILYNKPPPPPKIPPRIICQTDRETNVGLLDFCSKKPDALTKSTGTDAAAAAAGKKDQGGDKKKGKKGGGKKKK